MKSTIIVCLISFLGTFTLTSQIVDDYNLLLVESSGTIEQANAVEILESLGHTITVEDASNLISGYDYSNYDVILFMRDSPEPESLNDVIELNINGDLGIILFRGDVVAPIFDIGSDITFSDTDFIIENNTHYITDTFSTGILDLGFTYKTNLSDTYSDCTILGSVSSGNGALVVHNSHKRVLSPFYGHSVGTPTLDALILLDRIIAWAAFNNTSSTDDSYNSESVIKLYPNPSCDFIQISSLDIINNYIIYDMNGNKMPIRENIAEDFIIDIQHLPIGAYLLEIENEILIKFMKN